VIPCGHFKAADKIPAANRQSWITSPRSGVFKTYFSNPGSAASWLPIHPDAPGKRPLANKIAGNGPRAIANTFSDLK